MALACAEAEPLETSDDSDSGRGGAVTTFGGTYAAGKSSLGGGATGSNRGGGGAGGKATSGGAFGAGGAASRGGASTTAPPEAGQAGSITTGSPTCHFVGSGGAGGAAGASNAGAGGADWSSGGAAEVRALGNDSGAVNASGAGGTGSDPGSDVTHPFAFCDDFDDGDAGGWKPDSCSWSVVSDGSSAYESGGGACLSSVGLGSWTDQAVHARVKVIAFGGTSSSYRAGLFARYGGGSSYYTLALAGNGSLRLLRGTSVMSGTGQCGDLAANVTVDTWYTLRLEVSGPINAVRVRGYLNGALSHDCSVISNTVPSGTAGVITTGSSTVARFDDFRVTTD